MQCIVKLPAIGIDLENDMILVHYLLQNGKSFS